MAKILVVDDDQGILDAFEAMLESVGHSVQVSPDAGFVQSLSKKNLPDLILLDVLLSGADGREICKQLKNQKDTKNIPIIMISAHPSADTTAKEVCADDYLAKPFEMDDLLQKVESLLKRTR